jgi:hypothetical protein
LRRAVAITYSSGGRRFLFVSALSLPARRVVGSPGVRLVRASFLTTAPGPLLDGRFQSSLRGGTSSRQVFAGRPQGIRGLQRPHGVDARLRGRHLANSRSYPTLTGCSKSYSSAEPNEVTCTSGPYLGRRIPSKSRAGRVLSGVRRASRILALWDPRLFGTGRTEGSS